MIAASCGGGVRRYRYSGQLEGALKKSEFRKLILQSFLYFCRPNKGTNTMLDRLQIVKQRFDEISDLIIQPDVISDQKRYVQLNQEYKGLKALAEKRDEYVLLMANIDEANEIISDGSDAEMVEMAKMQLDEAKGRLPELEEEIKFMLIPKDPEDAKNVMVEVRAGTGGDEASIFAGDLFRMYTKYCEGRGWRTSVVDMNEGTSGGFKEVIFEVTGEDVYGTLKFEAGVHRVQRVPQTETQGRVHTSAATVMVLPEAEEFDVQIDMNDVRVDFFCSSGPGGQSVNTTKSAVRLTHIPTGLVAQCQDQKSQHKNKDKALTVLRSRLYEMELAKKQEEDASKRTSQVSSGDRSAKIRTYNYAQGRVTDHRIGLTLYDLGNIMNGDIQKIVDELQLVNNTEKLKEASEVF
jgi:peptide chain release factor 1